MTRTVAITGATGFIGKNLVERLVERNWRLLPLVRIPSGLRNEHVQDLTSTDLRLLDRNIDAFVHLAAHAGTGREATGTENAALENANIAATQSALRLAVEARASQFVYMSSVKAVGESTAASQPMHRRSVPEPKNWYGRSKLASERAVCEVCTRHNIRWTIVRSPMVFGRSGGDSFAALARLASLPIPIPLGGIDNARSVVHVTNLVDFILFCMDCPHMCEGIYYPSDGEPLSTSRIVSAMARAQGRKARLFGLPNPLLRGALSVIGLRPIADRLLDSLVVDSSDALALGWQPPLRGCEAITRAFRID